MPVMSPSEFRLDRVPPCRRGVVCPPQLDQGEPAHQAESVRYYQPVFRAVALDHRHRSGFYREEVIASVAFAEQQVPRLDGPHLADRTEPRHLRWAQLRKRSLGSSSPPGSERDNVREKT